MFVPFARNSLVINNWVIVWNMRRNSGPLLFCARLQHWFDMPLYVAPVICLQFSLHHLHGLFSTSHYWGFCKPKIFRYIYVVPFQVYICMSCCVRLRKAMYMCWIGQYHVKLLWGIINYVNGDNSNAPILLRTCIQFGSLRKEIIWMHLFFMGLCTVFGSVMQPFLLLSTDDVWFMSYVTFFCIIAGFTQFKMKISGNINCAMHI
jgi:hypothetical protein